VVLVSLLMFALAFEEQAAPVPLHGAL
jgi:hypothetical protein